MKFNRHAQALRLRKAQRLIEATGEAIASGTGESAAALRSSSVLEFVAKCQTDLQFAIMLLEMKG